MSNERSTGPLNTATVSGLDPNSDAFASAVRDFTTSEVFRRTFEEGMAMVEETAAYLDGPGREASKALPRKVALAYAGESMRLTTRLMQVASWLLVQRAIMEGEMVPAHAVQDKYRLGAKEVCLADPMAGTEHLPERLLELLEKSAQLYNRVDRLDDRLYRLRQPHRGVTDHFDRLAMAFGQRGDG